ncbi:DUF445 domain-containing protein [Roseomonas sp. OT10]|uniref:DUF445 domain-containing protein n=1 Tax=Roseomonas cutis TaxID=2897332 RepID=UPI001E284DE0|nr:DUF445 domain-containing protein [Roseomonas sp. OT10]UFN49603.1 DUF445 domain-containing protein [Roseomonas sp. OT10]
MQGSPSPEPFLPSLNPRSAADEALRQSLRRHRLLATGLLAGMAGLTVGAYALPPGWWTDLLQASAKAGLVGGLADWFAVTALFRRPLGLPIPHTAIIPRQKVRLGQSLGRFVADHVFTEGEVARLLQRLDLASVIAGVLADPKATQPAARAVATALPRLLANVQEGRASKVMLRLLPRLADGPAATRLLARTLRTLVEGGRHRDVFDLALREIRAVLRTREAALREEVEKRVREQGGSLVGWVAGAYVARRVVTAVNEALDEAVSTEGGESSLRAAFDEWVMRELDRLERDPERAAQIGAALGAALRHEVVAGWLDDAWHRLRWAVELDAAKPEGRIASLAQAALSNGGKVLSEDPAARARVNAALEGLLLPLLPEAQKRLSAFIAGVVANWDTATVTEKIELRVGRDLQYVRMNGTIVGFLAGGVLFALLSAVFGKVAF